MNNKKMVNKYLLVVVFVLVFGGVVGAFECVPVSGNDCGVFTYGACPPTCTQTSTTTGWDGTVNCSLFSKDSETGTAATDSGPSISDDACPVSLSSYCTGSHGLTWTSSNWCHGDYCTWGPCGDNCCLDTLWASCFPTSFTDCSDEGADPNDCTGPYANYQIDYTCSGDIPCSSTALYNQGVYNTCSQSTTGSCTGSLDNYCNSLNVDTCVSDSHCQINCPAGMSGNGVPGGECMIINWTQLQAMEQGLTLSYALANNLNSVTDGYSTYQGGAGFDPIGGNFKGHFDGNGKTISNLYINRPDKSNVGLFGVAYFNAEIKNVGLINVNITGKGKVGGLVGNNMIHISNSYSTGSVTGLTDVGGLVGYNWGGSNISNSYSTGYVFGSERVGGLVGLNSPNTYIDNSYSTSCVNGTKYVGGLVGTNDGTISNCYSVGCVNYGVTSGSFVGGLVGYNPGNCNNCFWDTETSEQSDGYGYSTGTCDVTGKTTSEMQEYPTFSDAGWDLDLLGGGGSWIWSINPSCYPRLIGFGDVNSCPSACECPPPPEPRAYWAEFINGQYVEINPSDYPIYREPNNEEPISLILEHAPGGGGWTFEIREKDAGSDYIRTEIPGLENNKWVYNWTVTQADITAAGNENLYKFYFKVIKSDGTEFLNSRDFEPQYPEFLELEWWEPGDAYCGDGTCDAGETCGDTNNAPECNSDCGTCVTPDYCDTTPIVICSDYTDETNCNTNDCGLPRSIPNVNCETDDDIDCGCEWKDGECGAYFDTYDPNDPNTPTGRCSFSQDTSVDPEGCADDGFLTTSLTASWSSDTIPPASQPDTCAPGSNNVLCPVQIKLPLTSWLSVIATIIVIMLVYFSLSNRRKK